MTQPAHARRFVQNAAANPQGFAQYTRQLTGHPPATTEALLQMHRHLHHGGQLTDAHVRTIQQAHPAAPPHWVAAVAADLNKQPAGQRPDFFLALLTGDRAAVAGRFNEAGADFRQVNEIAEAYHRHDIADELNKRRDGGQVKPESRERPVDPTSTRAIIEQQFEPPGARAAAEAVERGDPAVIRATRNAMADRMERATERLYDVDTDLRGTVAAAFDAAEVEAVAVDQGWLPERES